MVSGRVISLTSVSNVVAETKLHKGQRAPLRRTNRPFSAQSCRELPRYLYRHEDMKPLLALLLATLLMGCSQSSQSASTSTPVPTSTTTPAESPMPSTTPTLVVTATPSVSPPTPASVPTTTSTPSVAPIRRGRRCADRSHVSRAKAGLALPRQAMAGSRCRAGCSRERGCAGDHGFAGYIRDDAAAR